MEISKHRLLLIILLTCNILSISLLISIIINLDNIKVPQLDVDVEILDVSTYNLTVKTTLRVVNPNTIDLVIRDLKVTFYDVEGSRLGSLIFPSKTIHSISSSMLASIESFSLYNGNLTPIRGIVSGDIVFSIFFLTKTLPIVFSINLSIDRLLSITTPSLSTQVEVKKITDKGIEFTGFIEVENPNSFRLKLSNLSLFINKTSSEPVGWFSIEDKIIPSNTITTIPFQGMIEYEAIDEGGLEFLIKGSSILQVAGASLNMPVSTKILLNVPSLADALLHNSSGGFSMEGYLKFTLGGLKVTVKLGVTNPTPLTFSLTNISWEMLRVDGEMVRKLGEGVMEDNIISPRGETWLTMDIIIPYRDLLPRGSEEHLLSYMLEVTFKGLISIKGSTQYLPVFITGTI